jgi:Skp family chaperone for outer membrane proteins
MSRTFILLILFWNLVLTIVAGYTLTRGRSPAQLAQQDGRPDIEVAERRIPRAAREEDTLAVDGPRIAFFFMDTVQRRYTLVQESADRVRSEGRRLEAEFSREMQKAQTRAQELAQKDHTYSTQAQLQADQEEFQNLQIKIGELRDRSQDKLEELQIRMLTEIGKEIEEFLAEYNRDAGFDFIFSIQDGGQIWVGNDQLDVTADVVDGLNERHRGRKDATRIKP